MKHLGTIVVLALAMVVIGCSSGGADSSATNPLADIPPIEFETFEEASGSQLTAREAIATASQRYEYVNSFNEKLMVSIPNWALADLDEYLRRGGNLDQPVFIETTFPGSVEAGGYVDEFLVKATVQRVRSTEGVIFRGIISYRGVKDGSYSPEATNDNAPIEMFFSHDLKTARFAIGGKKEGEPYSRDAVEYYYKTKTGVMVSQWGEVDDESGAFRENIKYEGFDRDTALTYWFFQNDNTTTEVLLENSAGVGVGHFPKDTSAPQYWQIDTNGAEAGQPDAASQVALSHFDATLTDSTAEEDLQRIFDQATLTGGIFEELLEVHISNVSW